MKRIISVIVMALVVMVSASAAKPKVQFHEVLFQTNLHCKNCANKIVENVSFAKGVKDMKTDVDKKTVTIVYNPQKTSAVKLADAIRKLGYTAEVVEDKAL